VNERDDVAVRPLGCSSPLLLRHIQCSQLQLQPRQSAAAAAVVDICTVLRAGVAGLSTVDVALTSRQPSGALGARVRETTDEAAPTARCSLAARSCSSKRLALALGVISRKCSEQSASVGHEYGKICLPTSV
jgi:hypothetical protein